MFGWLVMFQKISKGNQFTKQVLFQKLDVERIFYFTWKH